VDLPRPNILKRDLAGMGLVYAVVLALLALALVVGLMPDRPPALPAEPQTEVIGAPASASN